MPEVWHYKDANIELIRSAINSFNWTRAFSNTSVNEKVNIFNNTIFNILSNFIPHEILTCDDENPSEILIRFAVRIFNLEILIRSADRIFNLEMLIRSADRIFDLEIVIQSADRILNLEILIRSGDQIFDLEMVIRSSYRIQVISYFSFKMRKHLKIKFNSFDTFCLILRIKQMSPLGFGN